MIVVLVLMGVTVLIPLYSAYASSDVWEKMLAFSSVATKTSLLVLGVSVWRDDWMIGLVGVLVLGAGNAALMLLSHLLMRLKRTGAC